MPEKILVFQHVKHEHARRFADLSDDFNFEFDVVEFYKDWKKPDLSKYSRLIIMGGPQSVYDSEKSFPSKQYEIETIKNFTKNKKPVLGCCLGSQLIAHAFGGKVYPNSVNGKRFKETGFYEIVLTEEGKKGIFNGFPDSFKVFQWHGDIFELPENAELLATGDFVKNQAFKIKDTGTCAMLFHFDFMPKMVEDIIKKDNKWLHADNEADEDKIVKEAYKYEKEIKELSQKLFKNWMEL